MVYNREQVVQRANASTTNEPNQCQAWTRGIVGVPAVGDYDGDKRADAEDGWRSEPAKWRHPGDRNPPAGVVVSYLGGSNDDGHRAISLGGGMIRSTDAGGRGKVATVALSWPERQWGLSYAGWSDSCNGVLIPPAPKSAPKPPTRVQRALQLLRDAAAQARRNGHPERAKRINDGAGKLPRR